MRISCVLRRCQNCASAVLLFDSGTLSLEDSFSHLLTCLCLTDSHFPIKEVPVCLWINSLHVCSGLHCKKKKKYNHSAPSAKCKTAGRYLVHHPGMRAGWRKHKKKSLFSSNKRYPGTFNVTMGPAFTASSDKTAHNTPHDALFICKAEGGKGIKGLWGSNYTSLMFIAAFVLALGHRRDIWWNSWQDQVGRFLCKDVQWKRAEHPSCSQLSLLQCTGGSLVHDAGRVWAAHSSPHLISPTWGVSQVEGNWPGESTNTLWWLLSL